MCNHIFFMIMLATYCSTPVRALAKKQPRAFPWLRLHGEAFNMKVDRNQRYIVFTDRKGYNLSCLILRENKIFRITRQKVGGSFFLSPDGNRIFFREIVRSKKGNEIMSLLKVYDLKSHRSEEIHRLEGLSGYLTFDPRDLRFQLMHEKGILSKMIVFPDERLAKWQLAQRTEQGKWLATPNGILWLTHSGFTMRKFKDDDTGIQSFDISPDGSSITWATKGAGVFYSRLGSEPLKVGSGFDPAWHPKKSIIIFSGVRKVGKKIVDTDIRMFDTHSERGRWLTFTQSASERWPRWFNKGKSVIFSLSKTTDVYRLNLKP